MCGIAGFFGKGSFPAEAVANRLFHRGPDGQGCFHADQASLLHTRLSIIDLEGGAQPLYSKDQQLVLVANGEIYNHVELRLELEAKGHQFSSHSDCETILHAYAEYGDDCLQHLFGMFAFALFDKAKQRMLIGRDRLGMKPLFLLRQENSIAFASEIKALLPLMDDSPSVNSYGLLQYLQNQNNTGRETIFNHVERLLPGEAAVLEHGQISRFWTYWSARDVQPQAMDFEQANKAFDGLMETVMQQHMRSDVPFGLFLSGGVDSTTLLGLLARYKEEPIRTFSVGFPKSSVGDELEIAERIAKHFGSQHTVLRPGGDAMLQRLPYSVWAADDLMRDFANLPTSMLAQESSKELKVVFSGEGGDEAFAGYGRYRTGSVERWLKNLLVPGTGGFRTGANFRGGLPKQVFGAALHSVERSWREPLIQAWQETPLNWTDVQRMQYLDLRTALPDNLLVKADRMLMAWGLEGRMPFVDHRVIEFGLSLPDALKQEGKQGKIFLKRWASGFVPGDHLWQTKRGFKVPVGQWLKGDYLMRVGQCLQFSPAIQQWFELAGVQALVERQHKRGDVSKNVFALLQFAIWHKIFIEGSGEAPLEMIDPVVFVNS